MKNGERHVSFILVLIQIAHMSFVPTSEAELLKMAMTRGSESNKGEKEIKNIRRGKQKQK